jgi:broad specificity phosphatase PhoE
MATIWLVRHGESQANAGGRTSNPATIELTERGHEQAKRVAATINQPPDLIVTSAYQRTKQTAQPLVERFPGVHQVEWPVQEFTYLAPERCHNTTAHERQPTVEAYWQRSDPWHNDGPGAESFAELIERTHACLNRIRAHQAALTVIFSHGQFMRTLLWCVITSDTSRSSANMRRCRNFMTAFALPNAAIVRLNRDREQTIWMSGVDQRHLPEALLTE